jgi:hypothetical protein
VTGSLLQQLGDWTDLDAAALALGRALGVFDTATTLADVKAVLWTNSAAGNTLYGMLERLAWLGVLEVDEARGSSPRYRAASAGLHALSEVADVPALEAGAPRGANIRVAADADASLRLEADRAGFRHLARVFDEIASSGLEPGWQAARDERFGPGRGVTLALVDPAADEPAEPR